MSRGFSRVLLVALPLLSACPKGPQAISDADKAALRAVEEKFTEGVLAKNWAAVAGLYAENATFMPPNEAARTGRAAIQAWMATFPPITAFKLTTQEVDGVGDLAYVRGTYELTVTPPGAPHPVTDHGKFLNVNRRMADGSWAYTNDMFNSDLPVAPPPAAKPKAPAKKPPPKKAPAKHK